jgi:hypothetical protein
MGNDLICGENPKTSEPTSDLPLPLLTKPTLNKSHNLTKSISKSPTPQLSFHAPSKSSQILGIVPYQIIDDFTNNEIVQAVFFEKERIFQDLRKDPVRKVIRPPNVSFASFKNLSDLWGSIHLKDRRLDNSRYLTSAEKDRNVGRRGEGRKISQFFSHREISLKESQVISNVSYKKGNEGDLKKLSTIKVGRFFCYECCCYGVVMIVVIYFILFLLWGCCV